MSQPSPAPGGHRDTMVVDAADMTRAIRRMAHEIVERHGEGAELVLAGIPTRGVPLAERLAALLKESGQVRAEVLELAVESHRDDRDPAEFADAGPEPGPVGAPAINNRIVVLVDDVIFHGRTARAALDALTEMGRPAAVQLAVLVDRGHRELPIRADYVGKNIPTHLADRVQVLLEEVDGFDAVFLIRDGE